MLHKGRWMLGPLLLAGALLTGCGTQSGHDEARPPAEADAQVQPGGGEAIGQPQGGAAEPAPSKPEAQTGASGAHAEPGKTGSATGQSGAGGGQAAGNGDGGAAGSSGKPAQDAAEADAIRVVAKPEAISALVNKTNKLPDSYKPDDLVDPDVPFTFKEKLEKRYMRKEAAEALEKLFAAAKQDGLPLAGVSAYRSRETQAALYASYVKRDGEAAASKYSAKPGHSEHETGLAVDVTASNGKCAAQNCFGVMKEAKWLDEHAHEYGFIIRYPKGKESITGYQYEPWHLRYVGVDTAKTLVQDGLTLEEYMNQGVPVSQPKR
ncbi:D-alanyl-D-alanine carboxypeptidase family protein [Paenibacillus sp. YYML68]|uniref:M15 family metallopeptidase n=1 Tax=Paenibacillus sp. YYML68 TaxID=2909250 RepID=UPI002490985B|nr:M15 family metallopeptidase [Paenibacillus sp. YYML68]